MCWFETYVFIPWWKYFHPQCKYSHRVGIEKHIYVTCEKYIDQIFISLCKYLCPGENNYTPVKIFIPRLKQM